MWMQLERTWYSDQNNLHSLLNDEALFFQAFSQVNKINCTLGWEVLLSYVICLFVVFQLTLALQKLAHFHALTHAYCKAKGVENFHFFNEAFKDFDVRTIMIVRLFKFLINQVIQEPEILKNSTKMIGQLD